MKPPELVLDEHAQLGEGPSWDDRHGVLYWVDIPAGLIHVYDPEKSTGTTINAGVNVSCVVPKKSGGMALTMNYGFYTLDSSNREISLIEEVERDHHVNRFNDGKCDSSGRFWAGTMNIEERNPSGALYCLERRKVRKVLSEVTISNGLGWSPENTTMYYIDSPTRKVSAFDYNPDTGVVENRRTVVDFSDQNQQGDPDGMAVDAEGMLWVAHWGGYRVTRWNPKTGRPLDYVALPAAHVTSCCFGGRNLDELYITTARSGLDLEALSKQPHSGGLFRIKAGVRGLPTYSFDA